MNLSIRDLHRRLLDGDDYILQHGKTRLPYPLEPRYIEFSVTEEYLPTLLMRCSAEGYKISNVKLNSFKPIDSDSWYAGFRSVYRVIAYWTAD